MIGARRMENVQELATMVVMDDIPGDFVECGVWRGGASILMRAVLAALGDEHRVVWAADSFRGLPAPDDERFPADAGDRHHTFDALAVSRAEVESNFARYGLLDERVRFLEGWFAETLHTAPIQQVALLRADGDMYGSTIDILTALHHKVTPGGCVIIDDYGLEPCRRAVHDFRTENGIDDEIVPIDRTGVFWRRPR
jgi:O-methyltransferase